MPSSGPPTDYKRKHYPFKYRGIHLSRPDALPDGKVSRAQNIRSYQEEEITIRDGMRRVTTNALGAPANSLFRLNDPALLAGGAAAQRFYGTTAGRLFAAEPAAAATAAYAEIDSGYSGDPLSGVPAATVNSPQPWLYVSDRDRMRKFNAALQRRSIGLPPPATPPTAAIQEVKTTFLQSIDSGSWVPYGGEAGAVSAAANTRLGTVVNAIIYDEGATGMASVALAEMSAVTEGATITVGVGGETVIVLEVIPSISPTTIAAILYDVGASGLCTIQPTGSFALGQTEAALPDELRERYHPSSDADPAPRRVTITRPVDFPVNALVMINGVELVRIQSIAIGPDGVMSFRAFTAGTYAAGQTLTGAACFRAFFNTTRAGGDPATAAAAENEITPTDAAVAVVAGIQTPIGPERDWSQVGDRAMQPDDMIMLSVRVDQLAYVEFVRLLLATNVAGVPAGQEFSRNYYQYEWRANDLIRAVQASLFSASAAGVQTMLDAQTGAVESGQAESFYQDGFGTEPLPMGGSVVGVPVEAPGLPPRTDGFVAAGTAPSRQLALGNLQWITLMCRAGDLLRVGTAPDRTLANLNAAAIVLQISGTAAAVTVQYSDVFITGGYGPDCGQSSPPYVWRYRYRSTITGERGNPSPSMRGGIAARRNRVELRATGCTEAQCDVIDWFRYGGTLARWSYVRSVANDVGGGQVTCFDDMADRQIDGGETLDVNLFQPWPTSDLPRSGTCRVVGTAVERISGDNFNTAWSPDTLIIVNGRATSLYGSPTSADRLTVIDNCDAGDPVEWTIPAPTLMAQPLATLWGGYIGAEKVWFNFACGDPTDPGALHWSHGNDPDSSSDANTAAVTSGTDPLQNGVIFDQTAYVFSTEALYRLDPAFGTAVIFRATKTACSRGLWNRWALCVADEGIYFVGQDGIFLTTGGEEISIVDPDLRALFPRDGSTPDPCGTHCLDAIDFLGPMKLTKVDQMLYFDYRSACDGTYRTLVYEPLYKRWTPDYYATNAERGARSRMEEPGSLVHTNVIGAQDGHGYQFQSDQMTDDGSPIPWSIATPWADGDDPRALKQWGDAVVEADSAQSCDGIRVEPVVDNGTVGLTATILGALTAGRQTYMVENTAGGVLSRNYGLLISGIIQALDIDRPRLFFWEPSFLWKQTPVARRVTDWEDLGYKGAKFVQGVVIRANTFNQLKTLAVEYDGGTEALQLPIHHNGEVVYAYPRDENGWAPFVGELVRLRGLDDIEWTLHDWRWVWEPAPESATQWETQDTTFDFPGYGHIDDAVLAYQSAVATTLTIWHGTSAQSYEIASSGNIYRRLFVKFRAAKGLSYRFRWTGDQPFRVFHRDTSMRAAAWNGGYAVVQPFGGPHRIAGAEV